MESSSKYNELWIMFNIDLIILQTGPKRAYDQVNHNEVK